MKSFIANADVSSLSNNNSRFLKDQNQNHGTVLDLFFA